ANSRICAPEVANRGWPEYDTATLAASVLFLLRATHMGSAIRACSRRRPQRIVAYGFGVWMLVGAVFGRPQFGRADEATRTVAAHAMKCAVGIYCKKEDFSSFFGTGAVVTADGHVLTSTTVVPPGATEIEVVFADFVVRPGKIIETNETLETTLLKVEATGLPFLAVAKEMPEVGSRAYTLSNANNVTRINGQASFSQGLISGIYEVPNQGGESLYSGIAIETTAAVNPGTDGGPILNENGQLCAVVSLNVSPSRWQGVGVPTKQLLERFDAFKNQAVKLSHEPLVPSPAPESAERTFGKKAAEWSPYLVGINVQRKHPFEVLPRMPWEEFRKTVPDFDKKNPEEKGKVLEGYFEAARLIEVNQMLRRPALPMTGVVISAEGHVLTSLFNVSDEVAFVDKASGKPRALTFKGNPSDLTKAPDAGFGNEANPVEKISVVLADGMTREATLVSRHGPLGVAVLKFEGSGLPFLDLKKLAAPPQIGDSVGLVGYAGGAGTKHTLNSGIISSPSRNRGFQFQIDALLNYGNSGGPVFGVNGEWLGVATAPIEPRTVLGRVFQGQELNGWMIAPNSGVGMIARADKIVEAIDELKSGKTITQIPGAFLGVSPDPQRAFSSEVYFGVVGPQSPAGKAGLKPGDQLLTIDGDEVSTWKDLTEHLSGKKPGDKVELKVRRPGIVKHLMLNGKQVGTEADLQELMKSLKPGEKVEGSMVLEDVKVFSVTLGERQ
ncbi:MAG TPA: trypsin-like peptidase domain-containing protein, partial [Pirellulaceae bacterium]|nr:trypsin-like peptidase domain-containing protein [Pirellulaceae bacterium]